MGHVQRLLDTLDRAAERGSEYWLRQDQDESRGAAERDEAQIVGLLIRLDGFLEAFAGRLLEVDLKLIDDKMNELTTALTGGDFGVRGRPRDFDRARLVHMAASELMVVIPAAVDRALTMGGYWRFARERADRWSRDAVDGFVPGAKRRK